MVATTHHPIHVPAPLLHAIHAAERFFGAVFFTVLAPLAFALAIVGALLLAIAVGRLI